MEKLLNRLIDKNRCLTERGDVADYIPILKKANARELGVSIIDNGGNMYSAGVHNSRFTIQSISKIFALILAIIDHGEEEVFRYVGMKATDEPFNTLFKLDFPNNEKPANPMINSGAIVITSLIKGEGDEKLDRMLEFLRKISANNKIDYNHEVFLSEKATGDKNRAIAYLLKNKKMIDGDVEAILDTYFKQCSIEMNCQDLAKAGYFIANGGRILGTGERLADGKTISSIIALMTTCGMYDYSGEYAVKVGIPSKSGVSGGILAASNGFGMGVYGPALDRYGNSIGGMGVLRDLSIELDLNIFA